APETSPTASVDNSPAASVSPCPTVSFSPAGATSTSTAAAASMIAGRSTTAAFSTVRTDTCVSAVTELSKSSPISSVVASGLRLLLPLPLSPPPLALPSLVSL
ncbi:unnamed protein product, partial [Ectocarpus sp. 12 AP-2014]